MVSKRWEVKNYHREDYKYYKQMQIKFHKFGTIWNEVLIKHQKNRFATWASNWISIIWNYSIVGYVQLISLHKTPPLWSRLAFFSAFLWKQFLFFDTRVPGPLTLSINKSYCSTTITKATSSTDCNVHLYYLFG